MIRETLFVVVDLETEAKVGEHETRLTHEDVCRLEIPMSNARRMHIAKNLREFDYHLYPSAGIRGEPRVGDGLLERSARIPRHYEPWPIDFEIAGNDRRHGDVVLKDESLHRPHFSSEPLAPVRIFQAFEREQTGRSIGLLTNPVHPRLTRLRRPGRRLPTSRKAHGPQFSPMTGNAIRAQLMSASTRTSQSQPMIEPATSWQVSGGGSPPQLPRPPGQPR